MTPRPSNGRMRPNHSLGAAFFIGVVISAFAVIVFITLCGAQP